MTKQLHADKAGAVTPKRERAFHRATGEGPEGQPTEVDSADRRLSAQEAKRIATAIARAALAGVMLQRMADGSFVAARWTMTRALPDIAAVESFLKLIGAPR